MEKKQNILFIVMDALRAKNLGCYGYKRNTSPNIDALAKEGVLFKNAYSSNNATEKSFLSILSSRHILLENQKNLFLTKKEIKNFFDSGGLFLQEILKRQGYKTYCLKELYSWQKRGFDFFYDMVSPLLKEKKFFVKLQNKEIFRNFFRRVVHYFPKNIADKIKANYGRTNGLRTTKDAIRIIKESKEKKEPFFLWVDYNDTHIPYNPKEFTGRFIADKDEKKANFFKIISKGEYNPEMIDFWMGAFSKSATVGNIIARYDDAIFYDDYLIGKIIETLKKENIFENTIVFFFSDHGESLDEHEIYFSHHGLYDASIHFPLIIYEKGLTKNKKIEGYVQHQDFVPTVLDLLKIRYDPNIFDGKSLLPLIKEDKKIRKNIFIEEGDLVKKRGIRTKKYKYIQSASKEDALCKYCNKIHGGLLELYDLKKDPGENNNIAKEQKNILVKMKIELEREIKNYKLTNEKRRIKSFISTKLM